MFLSSTASSSQPCHITEGLFFVIPSGVELDSIDLFRCPFHKTSCSFATPHQVLCSRRCAHVALSDKHSSSSKSRTRFRESLPHACLYEAG